MISVAQRWHYAALLGAVLAAAPGLALAQEDEASPEQEAPAGPATELAGDAGAVAAPSEDAVTGEQAEAQSAEAQSAEAPSAESAEGAEAQGTESAESEAEADDAEEAPAAEPLAWRNSFFTWQNSVTVNSFAPGAQLSYDPTFLMQWSLTPRWYLTPTTFLWANQTLSLELTDANDGTYNREPLLSDTLVDLRQLLTWEGFVFQGQARLGFPTSKASQGASRVLQTGLGLTVTRAIPEAANLTIATTFAYRRWWATSNVSRTATPYPGNCFQPTPGEIPVCTQAGGQTTDRDILVVGLSVTITPIDALSINLSGFYFATYGHELATGVVPINGGTVDVEDGSLTHWRAYTYLSLAVGYDFLPWLNVQLGVQNSNNGTTLYAPDGSVRAPFSYDTQVFLAGTISIDGIYGEFAGDDEEARLTPEERQRRRQGLARVSGTNAM